MIYTTKLKNYLMAEITRYTLVKAGFTVSDPVLLDVMDKSWKLANDLKDNGYTTEMLLEITNKYLDKIGE